MTQRTGKKGLRQTSRYTILTGPSGQSGVGGFFKTPIPLEIADRKAMVFEFGRNGFFGVRTPVGDIDMKTMLIL